MNPDHALRQLYEDAELYALHLVRSAHGEAPLGSTDRGATVAPDAHSKRKSGPECAMDFVTSVDAEANSSSDNGTAEGLRIPDRPDDCASSPESRVSAGTSAHEVVDPTAPARSAGAATAMAELAARHPHLDDSTAALATIGCLARLAYAALRSCTPPPAAPATGTTALIAHAPHDRLTDDQARHIGQALDHLDFELLTRGADALAHCSVELARRAMAEHTADGTPLDQSAPEPLSYALAQSGPGTGALLLLLCAGAELALACLNRAIETARAAAGVPGAASGPQVNLGPVLDRFELFKITQQVAGAGAP